MADVKRDGTISMSAVSKTFNGGTTKRLALDAIDLEIRSGEFVAIIGPSGCGKSTLLSMLGGFARPTSGEVLLDGEIVSGPSTRLVTIFQDYGLFPWRSVRGNVEFGLEAAGVPARERREEAMRWLELVGLSDVANSRISELSGGMRQRVNLARALAVKPEVLLMDEPLGALDLITRARVQEELREIAHSSSATIVMVTHDIDEALYLADRVLVMTPCPGRIAAEISVRLDHPRDRTSPAFSALRSRLLEQLHVVHTAEYCI